MEHPVLTSASAARVLSTGAHSSLDLAPAYAHPERVQNLPACTSALRRLEEEYQLSLQTGYQWDCRDVLLQRHEVSTLSLGVAWLPWTSQNSVEGYTASRSLVFITHMWEL